MHLIQLQPLVLCRCCACSLIGSCWHFTCQKSGPVIISVVRTECCKSFPLPQLQTSPPVTHIQSSVHVWAAEEKQSAGQPTRELLLLCKSSSLCSNCKAIVNPHLTDVFFNFAVADIELATRCTAQMQSDDTLRKVIS